MTIDWNHDLETGIDELDNQHKSIFDNVNAMLESVQARRGKEEVGRLLNFLGDYVVTHFTAEEKFMEERQYPNLAAHRATHLLFLNDFQKLKSQFEKEGASVGVVLATQRRVVDWLFDHIRGTDKVMAAYLRSRPRQGDTREKSLQ